MMRLAALAGLPLSRTRRGVPTVEGLPNAFTGRRQRRVCWFGRSNAFACFFEGERVGLYRSGVRAARWLRLDGDVPWPT